MIVEARAVFPEFSGWDSIGMQDRVSYVRRRDGTEAYVRDDDGCAG